MTQKYSDMRYMRQSSYSRNTCRTNDRVSRVRETSRSYPSLSKAASTARPAWMRCCIRFDRLSPYSNGFSTASATSSLRLMPNFLTMVTSVPPANNKSTHDSITTRYRDRGIAARNTRSRTASRFSGDCAGSARAIQRTRKPRGNAGRYRSHLPRDSTLNDVRLRPCTVYYQNPQGLYTVYRKSQDGGVMDGRRIRATVPDNSSSLIVWAPETADFQRLVCAQCAGHRARSGGVDA